MDACGRAMLYHAMMVCEKPPPLCAAVRWCGRELWQRARHADASLIMSHVGRGVAPHPPTTLCALCVPLPCHWALALLLHCV